MLAHFIELPPDTVLWSYFLFRRHQSHDLHFYIQPSSLLIPQPIFSCLLFFYLLIIVERDTDNRIQDNNISKEEEQDEEDLDMLIRIIGGSIAFAGYIHGMPHQSTPTFHGGREKGRGGHAEEW